MVPQRFASFLLISWIGFVSGYASAQQFKDELTIPESYPKDYLFALYSGNQPVGISRNELETHLKTPGISYHHRLAHPWVVSVGYRPQSFIKREDQQPMSLLTFSNSTQRIFRLYHPVYFLLGTEILYLLPVLKLNPPLTKDPDFATEIGVGGRASLWFLLGQKSILALDLERWRGTKTNRLHGLSLSLGLAWGL